ncbi:MAG TPA: putative quinol monooxygenase [Candidatus Sulfotelmatobacter sp.]|nr:putative quinol monooxygenase [Candidatus Sulfotelmatobacter sp.]
MLVQAVIYTFPADKADQAEEHLRALAAASIQEAGCHGFLVTRGISDPTTFVLYETWADQAAIDLHYATAHFQTHGVNGIRVLAASRTAILGRPVAQ